MDWTAPLADSDVLALLMDHFPGLLFVKDEQYRIVAANGRFLSLYPKEHRDKVIGTTTLEDYSPEQRNLFLAEDRKALNSGYSEVVERIDFPGGQTRTVLTKKVGKTGTDGRRYLIGASVDITELEEKRSEAAQLWELIDHTSAEIFIVDEETLCVLRMSSGARKNLGLEEQPASDVHYSACLSPELLERFLKIRRTLSERSDVQHMRGAHVRVDGSKYEVEAQVLRGRLSSSEVMVVVAQDVHNANQQRRTLSRQNDSLTEFAYRVSHDLRSPVVSGLALVELATEVLDGGDSQQAREILVRASQVLRQAEKLAEDLLMLTRIEQLNANAQSVSLADLVAKSIERNQVLYGDGLLSFQVELGHLDQVTTDPQRLQWIVDNLLSNAIKYRDPSQELSWVRVTASRQGEHVVLQCEDNGLGVALEHQPKLFGMFQRFHARVADGSGLGLFMVSRTASSLGGEARFESCKSGARFVIALSERVERWT